MLNVSDAMTAGAVREYFQEGGHDYYIDGRNPPGIWSGNLAREFGLDGEVRKEHFDRMACILLGRFSVVMARVSVFVFRFAMCVPLRSSHVIPFSASAATGCTSLARAYS